MTYKNSSEIGLQLNCIQIDIDKVYQSDTCDTNELNILYFGFVE